MPGIFILTYSLPCRVMSPTFASSITRLARSVTVPASIFLQSHSVICRLASLGLSRPRRRAAASARAS